MIEKMDLLITLFAIPDKDQIELSNESVGGFCKILGDMQEEVSRVHEIIGM